MTGGHGRIVQFQSPQPPCGKLADQQVWGADGHGGLFESAPPGFRVQPAQSRAAPRVDGASRPPHIRHKPCRSALPHHLQIVQNLGEKAASTNPARQACRRRHSARSRGEHRLPGSQFFCRRFRHGFQPCPCWRPERRAMSRPKVLPASRLGASDSRNTSASAMSLRAHAQRPRSAGP